MNTNTTVSTSSPKPAATTARKVGQRHAPDLNAGWRALHPSQRDLCRANAIALQARDFRALNLSALSVKADPQAFAANVVASQAAANLSGTLVHPLTGRPSINDPDPLSVSDLDHDAAYAALHYAIVDDCRPEDIRHRQAAAGIVWAHLEWVPRSHWVAIDDGSMRGSIGLPGWTYDGQSFIDDLVLGPTSAYYSGRTNTMVQVWGTVLGAGFQGIRVLSVTDPDSNLWVDTDGTIVGIDQAPEFAQRAHNLPTRHNTSAAENALANPWFKAVAGMRIREGRGNH